MDNSRVCKPYWVYMESHYPKAIVSTAFHSTHLIWERRLGLNLGVSPIQPKLIFKLNRAKYKSIIITRWIFAYNTPIRLYVGSYDRTYITNYVDIITIFTYIFTNIFFNCLNLTSINIYFVFSFIMF